MSNCKYCLSLRERPIFGSIDEERPVELKSLKDILERLTKPYEMHLYLGIYDIGEIVGWNKESIEFEGLLSGKINLLLEEWAPISISKKIIGNALNCEFTLEEFLRYIWGEMDIQFMLVDEPYKAWKLLQDHWFPGISIREIINPKLANEEMLSNEQRILFLK